MGRNARTRRQFQPHETFASEPHRTHTAKRIYQPRRCRTVTVMSEVFAMTNNSPLPEHTLLYAIIERAVLDYCEGNKTERWAVARWLVSKAKHPFSCFWCCEHLGIIHSELLKRVRSIRATAEQRMTAEGKDPRTRCQIFGRTRAAGRSWSCKFFDDNPFEDIEAPRSDGILFYRGKAAPRMSLAADRIWDSTRG